MSAGLSAHDEAVLREVTLSVMALLAERYLARGAITPRGAVARAVAVLRELEAVGEVAVMLPVLERAA